MNTIFHRIYINQNAKGNSYVSVVPKMQDSPVHSSEDQLIHAKKIGQKIKLSGYGLVVIDNKLDELVLENVESISIKGKLVASPEIKKHFQAK